MTPEYFMLWAIEKAKESIAVGGFPAGAIVVVDGKVVGEGISIGNKLHYPTSHSEMAAICTANKMAIFQFFLPEFSPAVINSRKIQDYMAR